MKCSACPAELDPEDVHDDHEPGCSGPPCRCDRPVCARCCGRCEDADAALADGESIARRSPWRNWTRTLARWTISLTPGLADDPPALEDATRHLLEELEADVAREGQGVHRLGPAEVKIADSHADFFAQNRVAILAEYRVLWLWTPNPFPELELWPWLKRLEDWLR